MKKGIALLLLIFLLSSCNNKKKFEGVWYDNYLKNNHWEIPRQIKITEDSISFNYPYIDYWNTFDYNLKRKKITFDDFKIPISKIKDTIYLDTLRYINKEGFESNNLEEFNSKIIINLPRFNDLKKVEGDHYSFFFSYGKRHDNNQYSLSINDKYVSLESFPHFLAETRSNFRREIVARINYHLFCDKNANMKDLEKVFLTMSTFNSLKISFVNDIHLTYNDSIGFTYKYERLTKNIPPFLSDDKYFKTVLENVPPPPPPYNWFESQEESINYVLLIKNKTFYKNKEVDISELKPVLQRAIEDQQIIFSLYDLSSNYKNFLELTSQITNIYYEKRNENSKKLFNKEFAKLNSEELDSIRKSTPMKYFWSYSIPHYRSLHESNPKSFGQNSKPIDSLLPN